MESKEVLELIRRAKAGDNEATGILIERYLKTVRKINHKWGNSEDGFQEGIFGIYQAIKTYDESYNTKFMTHLYFYVEAKIRRFIDKEKYRVPQYIIESIKKGEKERLYFSSLENLEIEELLRCCTIQEKKVIRYLFFDGYTGEEVAKKLQISRQRVHIIKFKALEKIRNKGKG